MMIAGYLLASAFACSITLFAKETVDITTLDWISKVPELKDLKGIRVPAGQEGLLKSFEVTLHAVYEYDRVSMRAQVARFKAARHLFHEDRTAFRKAHYLPSEELFEYALIKNDTEIIEYYLASSRIHVKLNAETKDSIAAYIRAHPKSALKFFPDWAMSELKTLMFLLSLNLSQEQVGAVFAGKPYQPLNALETLCTKATAAYLLRPEIKLQVRQLYNVLTPENQKKVQLPLYYRSILEEEEVEGSMLPTSNLHFHSLLLGKRDSSILLNQETLSVQCQVYEMAHIDMSVIDWFVANVNRSLAIGKETSNPITNTTEHALSVYKKLQVPLLLKYKKVAAHAFSGQLNYARFLAEAPIEILPLVSNFMAHDATAEEMRIYLKRVDEETIIKLFNFFWTVHQVEEEFVACANLLLDRIGKIKKFWKVVRIEYDMLYKAEKLLKHPEILKRILALGIRTRFSFFLMVDIVKDPELFKKLLPVREIFKNSQSFDSLNLHHEYLDRFLKLVNVSVHDLVKLHWSQWDVDSIKWNTEHFYRIFLFLKRWKKENPKKVAKLLASDKRSLQELVGNSRVLGHFDEESQELIRAYILMGHSIKKQPQS